MTQSEMLENTSGAAPIETTAITYNEMYERGPIWIRGNEEGGYYATLGKHRVTDRRDTKEEVEEELTRKDWSTILTMVVTMVSEIMEHERTTKGELEQE